MPEREKILIVVREWITKAESDLTASAHILKLGANSPADTVCFHAQQCVEKYLKAVLVYHLVDFPKTHDIEQIVRLLPGGFHPTITVEEQKTLTRYATAERYPPFREVPVAEARRAVALARRVRRDVRKHLPKEALRAGRR
jgi:HEPN domain-containing protein